jgi:hypothetical protein
MHVYLREEPVRLRLRQVPANDIVPENSELLPIAFFVEDNETPSFRAVLPPETVAVLTEVTAEPVQIGLLADEPEDPRTEIRAMVGIAVPVEGEMGEMMESQEEGDEEPWRASLGDAEAWRGEDEDPIGDERPDRTALLAFAPLVRLSRRFPNNFGEELADLLESALQGATRPALEARVDRMLEDL